MSAREHAPRHSREATGARSSDSTPSAGKRVRTIGGNQHHGAVGEHFAAQAAHNSGSTRLRPCPWACAFLGPIVCVQALLSSASQAQEVQNQLASSLRSWGPIRLNIGAGTFNLDKSILLDLTSASGRVAVTITGQGADKTILDCQGGALTAVRVKGAASTVLSDLTVRGCSGLNAGAGSSAKRSATHICPADRAVAGLRRMETQHAGCADVRLLCFVQMRAAVACTLRQQGASQSHDALSEVSVIMFVCFIFTLPPS